MSRVLKGERVSTTSLRSSLCEPAATPAPLKASACAGQAGAAPPGAAPHGPPSHWVFWSQVTGRDLFSCHYILGSETTPGSWVVTGWTSQRALTAASRSGRGPHVLSGYRGTVTVLLHPSHPQKTSFQGLLLASRLPSRPSSEKVLSPLPRRAWRLTGSGAPADLVRVLRPRAAGRASGLGPGLAVTLGAAWGLLRASRTNARFL